MVGRGLGGGRGEYTRCAGLRRRRSQRNPAVSSRTAAAAAVRPPAAARGGRAGGHRRPGSSAGHDPGRAVRGRAVRGRAVLRRDADLHREAAGGERSRRQLDEPQAAADGGGGEHAGAAGQRLGLDAAFVAAQLEVPWRDVAHEVDVGARRAEGGMGAQRRAERGHRRRGQGGGPRQHEVRHADGRAPAAVLAAGDLHGQRLRLARRGELEGDGVGAGVAGEDRTGAGDQGGLAPRPAEVEGEAGGAASAVDAQLGAPAVGVEVGHHHACRRRRGAARRGRRRPATGRGGTRRARWRAPGRRRARRGPGSRCRRRRPARPRRSRRRSAGRRRPPAARTAAAPRHQRASVVASAASLRLPEVSTATTR